MKMSCLEVLCCPVCHGTLALRGTGNGNTDRRITVDSGILECQNCHRKYAIKNGIPRFTHDHGVENFSKEWRRFGRTQLDSCNSTQQSYDSFIVKTGFNLAGLHGRRVLDAGCGAGRYTEIALAHGGEVFAVDASESVVSAQENIGEHPLCHVLQADVLNLPLREQSFDYIFSLGVLHHTVNTKQAFMRLLPLLKPDGEIAIWVYSAEGARQKAYNALSGVYRAITTRIPLNWVYTLSEWTASLYKTEYGQGKTASPATRIISMLVPHSSHPDPEWRVLDTFDWYSAKYQHKHTYAEVESWFHEGGLIPYRLDFPVAVKGRRHCES